MDKGKGGEARKMHLQMRAESGSWFGPSTSRKPLQPAQKLKTPSECWPECWPHVAKEFNEQVDASDRTGQSVVAFLLLCDLAFDFFRRAEAGDVRSGSSVCVAEWSGVQSKDGLIKPGQPVSEGSSNG